MAALAERSWFALPNGEFHKAEFPATLRGKWQTTDDEGETTIKLVVPASHLAEVLKLNQWLGKLLKVTVEPDEAN